MTFVLRTYSMEQTRSWEANRFSAGQEIPCILWQPKIYYHIDNLPPSCPNLSQINPVHAPHLSFWRFILILSSHLFRDLPSDLLPLGFPTKILYTPLLSPLRVTPISVFYHPNSIWWEAQIIKLLYYAVFSTSLLPRLSYTELFTSAPYSQTPWAYVPLLMRATMFHTRP
jgi:hypothetical protein